MDRQNLTLLTDLYELTMMQGYFKHKDKNEIVADQETDKQENIIIETPIINNDINYIGMGLMSLSAIFLFITIIFSIIFTKHQLNRRKKLSK